ncbi:hypothetical protein B9479_004205 [Cryptococcus floricola]|uniref:Uncharacterized protein n=1 Tax=Cryptococcus floricola TaxID=2591691 RepID=A0A5D3AUL3_9TREE|nr:hypothetical protein B9479_004205 [Cryptococcus floricola]
MVDGGKAVCADVDLHDNAIPPPTQPVAPSLEPVVHAPEPVAPTSQPVAHPASRSLVPVRRWRELLPIVPNALPSGDGGFDGVMRDLFANIADQDKRAYDAWIEIEFRRVASRGLRPGEENDARNEAKKEIDDHREFSVWATAVIPTIVFILTLAGYIIG